jgi:type II secretory pathway pseudopilin PulG
MSALAVGAVAGALASSAARRFSENSRQNSSAASYATAQEQQQQQQQQQQQAQGKNVGILAMEVYTPSTFVSQADLEEHAGIPAGKYTVGLGQEGLALTGDAEDINSLCLSVVHALLEK